MFDYIALRCLSCGFPGGWSLRLSDFNYCIAIFLTLQYTLDPRSGLFSHYEHPPQERRWLSDISYENGIMTFSKTTYEPAPSFEVPYFSHS